ncbi:hypothetical protein RRG08_025943 [Elysia crispata]|uniref:Allatotropin n=1 Tax=Elysia crispata TaxID=231223 RepID=A0AAE0ZFX6_9GAST|nr:hypothetical protein RRG08_025943 [Elysia crispata]
MESKNRSTKVYRRLPVAYNEVYRRLPVTNDAGYRRLPVTYDAGHRRLPGTRKERVRNARLFFLWALVDCAGFRAYSCSTTHFIDQTCKSRYLTGYELCPQVRNLVQPWSLDRPLCLLPQNYTKRKTQKKRNYQVKGQDFNFRPSSLRHQHRMFPRASLWSQLGVAILVLSLCNMDVVSAVENPLHRSKRGFRSNSASRVAHGYGKRGSFLSLSSPVALPLSDEQQQLEERLLPKIGFSDLPEFSRDPEEDEGSIASVEEFTDLLTKHPSLARAVVRKFVDIDRNGVISTAELFRSPARK